MRRKRFEDMWVTLKVLRFFIKLRDIGDFNRYASSSESSKKVHEVFTLEQFTVAIFVD